MVATRGGGWQSNAMRLLVSIAALLALWAPASAADAPSDALARKQRSETRLIGEKVPVNRGLPVIEAEAEAKRRNAEEIATRALALVVVSLKGSGAPESEWKELLHRFDLEGQFTPSEQRFIADPAPSEQDKVQFSWRSEAACTLLWAIGRVDALGSAREGCSASAGPILRAPSRVAVVATARLRPIAEILDEADLNYRYRWALVDADIGGKPVPEWLNGDIAMERHHAFNWQVQDGEQGWDDISLDT